TPSKIESRLAPAGIFTLRPQSRSRNRKWPPSRPSVTIRRLHAQQMPHEKVVQPANAVVATEAVVFTWPDNEVEIFVGFDQGVSQAECRFRGHIRIHLAHNQHQLAAKTGGVFDVR